MESKPDAPTPLLFNYVQLPTHSHRHRLTPNPDGGVVHAVDGAVFPVGEGGGLCVGIGVAGRGVVGEVDEAFAVVAVHFDAQDVDPFAVAVEFPRNEHSGGGDVCGEVGAQGEEVWCGFLGSDEAEIAAHGGGAEVILFQFGHEVEDAVEAAFGGDGDSAEQGRWGEDGEDKSASGAGLGLY